MFDKTRKHAKSYKGWVRGGYFTYVLVTLIRIVIFPFALIHRLWDWVYYEYYEER